MSGSFPACVAPLIERLDAMGAPTRVRIGGVEALAYAAGAHGAGTLGKALCIAPPVPLSCHGDLLDGANRLDSPCVECIIIAGEGDLRVQDLANVRDATIDEGDLDPHKIDCICRYVDTGQVIFLDPVFEDPDFLKKALAAFSSNIALLTSAGLQDRGQCVRAALQVAIDTCLASLKVQIQASKVLPSLSTALPTLGDAIREKLYAPWRSIPNLEARLDGAVICRLMEQSILSADKKRTGSYFTPRSWAWYTCHEALVAYAAATGRDGPAGQLAERDLQRLRILDPAMGSGDFLDAMSIVLVDAWLPLLAGSRPGEKRDWNALRLQAKLENIFKHNLHGIDLNKLAVEMTRVRLFLNALKHVSKDPTLKREMERFAVDLVHDDFLTRGIDPHCYDIVIGNPPYLMEVRNNQALFRHYSKHPATRKRYEPKMDLFYFFMFKGIEILKDRGVMGFVVQEYWLDRFHARRVRQFMFRETTIVELTLFKRCRVFQTAPGQHTMIIVATRGEASDEDVARIITVQEGSSAGTPLLGELLAKSGGRITVHHARNGSMYDFDKDKVFVSGDAEHGLFERVHAMAHHTIQEHEIQVGINIPQPFVRRGGKVEGVFVVPRDQVPRIASTPEEQALIKPFHKATDIGASTFSASEGHFIIYTTNESMKRVERDREAYARVRTHLDRYATAITSDHKPYGLHRPRQPEWFEAREKIIGVRKTRSPKFAVVPQDYYMDQAALFIRLDPARGISPYYACAFLNCPVAFKVLSGIKTQGGQLQIDKSVLARLPIPACHEADHRVISCLSEWIHVFGLMKEDRKAFDDEALVTRIRGIIDWFFDRLVEMGGVDPLISADGTDEVPWASINSHLVKRRCIDGMEHIESTIVDVESLHASTSPLLPSLEAYIDRFASRGRC
ncbi:MAG: N-6 DNA methylase [Candidatus Lokiarchaeota archaeon]|nr:N-6 DNA methylase [Candidatus Lokiarchaeota archaeon]